MDDLAQDDIDRLAHARSFSVASVAPSAGTPTREDGATIEASLAALAEQAERLSDGELSGVCELRTLYLVCTMLVRQYEFVSDVLRRLVLRNI